MRMTFPVLALAAALVPGLAMAQSSTGSTSGRPPATVQAPMGSSTMGGAQGNATTANPGGMNSTNTGGDNQITPSQGAGRGAPSGAGVLPQGAPGTSPTLNPPNGSSSDTN